MFDEPTADPRSIEILLATSDVEADVLRSHQRHANAYLVKSVDTGHPAHEEQQARQ
jgi:hypothetical protein